MDIINWSNYNSTDFTYFCSALLSFEFGNKFRPFTRPGRDGGIDGYYAGKHGDQIGNWRFQYKFHKTGYRQSISQLKIDIKSEADKLTNDVNHFIILTNVELLPAAFMELEKVWSDLNIKNTSFELWDGAKLFTLSLRYPLIALWLSDGFDTAQLVDSKVFFDQNMNPLDPLEPSSLNNFYVENTETISALEAFISSDRIMFNLTGEAGLGKTRSVIELFKTLQSHDESWVALVLSARTIDFDKISKAISAERKHIILIDDAHTYDSKIISDLFAICKLKSDKAKLILTSRQSTASEPLNLIKEYDQDEVLNFTITALGREQTRTLFLHYLENNTIKTYLDELVSMSYGKPILIVAMLNAINKGKLSDVKETSFLQTYVHNYFKAFAEKVQKDTGISSHTVNELIKGIALIEPLNFNQVETLDSLALLAELKKHEIESILQALQKGMLVDGRWEQSIKPDLYSDILLSKITQNQIQKYLHAFPSKINNVIVNLSSIDSSSGSQELLDDLIRHYITSVKSLPTILQFENISNTISLMGGLKPEAPRNLVSIYIECLEDQGTIYSQELIKLTTEHNPYFPYKKAISLIAAQLSALLHKREYYSFVFESIFYIQRKFRIERELNVIYSFGRLDYFDKMKLLRQTYFTQRASDQQHEFTVDEVFLAIDILNSFLPLDYTITTNSLRDYTVNILTYYIPNSSVIDDFREKVIQTLFQIFKEPKHTQARAKVLKSLFDIPRAIFATKRTKLPYDGDKQIRMVLDFILEQTEAYSTQDKSIVKEQLQYIELWDKANLYNEKTCEIKKNLTPINLTEELIEILSREIGVGRKSSYEELVEATIEKSKKILDKVNARDLAISIIEAHSLKGNDLTYFFVLYNQILQKEQSFLLEFYNCILGSDTNFFTKYGSPILRIIRFKFEDHVLFSRLLIQLKGKENALYDNVILDVYSSLSEAINNTLHREDLEAVITIIEKADQINDFSVSQILPTLAKQDLPYTIEIAKKYFDRCGQSDAEYTFMWLTTEMGYCYELFSVLLLTKTSRFRISYQIERTMNLVLKKEGPETIFEYLKDRFTYFRENYANDSIQLPPEFVPVEHSSDLFLDRPDDRILLFEMALKWYVSLVDDLSCYFAKNIFEYLSESDQLEDSLMSAFEKVSIESANDPDALNRLLTSLNSFTSHKTSFIDLVLKIFEFSNKNPAVPEALKKNLYSNAYVALTNTGTKMGTPGQPFAEDVLLLEMLKQRLENIPDYHPAYQLLSDAKKTMEQEINSGYDLNNETWQ